LSPPSDGVADSLPGKEGYQRSRMMRASTGQARRINTSTTREGTAMNTFDEHDNIISDNGIDAQRDII
jgi:hypothetical protein